MRSFLPLIFFICLNYGLPASDITATLDSADGTSGFSFKDSASVEQARIDSDGNLTINGKVGIGTPAPNTSLEIRFDSPDSTMTGLTAYGGLHFDQSATNDDFVGITTTATSAGTQGGILFQGSGAYGTKIHFLTTDSYAQGMKNRMTLNHLGYLGIGTDSPTAPLDVNGIMRSTAVYAYGSDDTQRATSSTAHIFEDNMSCTIAVRNGDLVYTQINGDIWCVPAASNSWIRVERSAGVAATVIMDSSYAGNGTVNYIGVTTSAIYRADADGTLTFKMKWHTNSGTAYCIYRRIFAWVMGKA
ncbi:MAG: hypothetical protein PHQ23_03560 [Candidatus Wallbacteria bacterium]|nr:hypothetical protein [Candidatus Wallbacteria bacterium]